jgi:DNA polymerase-3 subunit epsilon
MTLLHKEQFVCFDLETTGLDPAANSIIEVAAARFTFDGVLESYESLVDPEIPISAESIAIHHITDEMVKGKPKIGEILQPLLKFLGSDILIGHGITLDIAFLLNAAKRLSIPCKLESQPYLDTLRMARLYGESPFNSLEKLREHFNIESEGAHRAMSDVIVNIEVFKFLAKQYKTTHELFERLKKPIQLKTMPLGKHKGRPFAEVPIEYLQWAAHKDFDQDLLFSIRSEIRRRKQGKPFAQAANPFSSL